MEEQWTKNLRQYLGEYDGNVKIDEGRSRAYPRITRVKVVSMVSRLMALLFPTSESNWALQASPSPQLDEAQLTEVLQKWAQERPNDPLTYDELESFIRSFADERAEKLEREITDQLRDTAAYGAEDYEALVRQVVHSAVLYSMGVLKGPMTITESTTRVAINEGAASLVAEVGYRPTFEFVPVWDYYPDLSAKTFQQMDGQFHRHIYSKHQLRQLADRQDFFGSVITEYIRTKPDGNYTKLTYETDLQQIAAATSNAKDVLSARRKYEVIEWWGYVGGDDLRKAGVEVSDTEVANDVRATLWILDDVVIKAARDPFPDGTCMYHQFIFEDDEVNLCGSGLPPIMRDSQLAVASAARMLIDNASTVCGPNLEVDLSLLDAGVSANSVRSFAIWYKRDDAPSTSGRAVQSVTFDSHMDELLKVIDTFMSFADKETFVNPMTGGDFENAPSEPMRTASGMSMILGTTALPFRDIVRNFDRFTVSVIHSLVQWNRVFNNRPGLFGDVRPIGRGATSLIAKEVRALALDNLATTLRDDEAIHIDSRELARSRVMVRDLPVDTLMVSEAESKRRLDAREQQAAATAQLQNDLLQAQIKGVNADTFKATSQAQKNLDNADVAVFKAVTDAVAAGVDPNAIIQFIQREPTAVVSNQGQPGGPGTASISSVPVGGVQPEAVDGA